MMYFFPEISTQRKVKQSKEKKNLQKEKISPPTAKLLREGAGKQGCAGMKGIRRRNGICPEAGRKAGRSGVHEAVHGDVGAGRRVVW